MLTTLPSATASGADMSAGYVPLFGSLTTGTLCGRWPDVGLWAIILSLADRDGIVDVTPEYIAGITGLSRDDVIATVGRFCEPDSHSRSPAEGGRRLMPLDPGRLWGWRVVNHGKYRERARKRQWDIERTASGRDADRKRRDRGRPASGTSVMPPCPDASRLSPLSDSDSDSDSDKNRRPRKRGTRLPDNWRPDLEAEAYAKGQGLDPAAVLERFRDHWVAVPGQRGVKLDWAATWRTWCRRDAEHRPGGNRTQTPKHQKPATEREMAAARALAAADNQANADRAKLPAVRLPNLSMAR